MQPQSVRLFGMHVRSGIPLPGLESVARVDPDIVIELGDVPVPLGPPQEIAVDEHGATLTIEGVARYRVSNGSTITVDSCPGVPEANVRLFLLGSAMGLLLHQRGLLPLHGSAVEIDGRAVALIGPSGAGKSTLAAAFHDRGHRVLADDVCVVGFDEEGRAIAHSGIPRLRLWEDALAATGRAPEGHDLSYPGDESFRKFDVPIGPDGGAHGGIPLAAVFHLCPGRALQFRPLAGSEAADAIFANTYRGEYVRLAGDPSRHWEASVRLLGEVPVIEMSRRRGFGGLGEQVRRIAGIARQISRPGL